MFARGVSNRTRSVPQLLRLGTRPRRDHQRQVEMKLLLPAPGLPRLGDLRLTAALRSLNDVAAVLLEDGRDD